MDSNLERFKELNEQLEDIITERIEIARGIEDLNVTILHVTTIFKQSQAEIQVKKRQLDARIKSLQTAMDSVLKEIDKLDGDGSK